MDALVELVMTAVKTGGSQALAVVGWALYLIERFYVAPKLAQNHKEDIERNRLEFKEVSDKSTEVLGQFVVVLEVIKDRLSRGGGSQ